MGATFGRRAIRARAVAAPTTLALFTKRANAASLFSLAGGTLRSATLHIFSTLPSNCRMTMEPPARPSGSLFDVYLRLRPSKAGDARFLTVQDGEGSHPTHITIKPPTDDKRKRAVESFAFTKVFQEDAQQMDLFEGTGVAPMIEGVLGAPGHHGRDGTLATLGMTGSGKVGALESI